MECEPDTLAFDADSVSVLRSCFKQRSKEHTQRRLSRRLTCLKQDTLIAYLCNNRMIDSLSVSNDVSSKYFLGAKLV